MDQTPGFNSPFYVSVGIGVLVGAIQLVIPEKYRQRAGMALGVMAIILIGGGLIGSLLQSGSSFFILFSLALWIVQAGTVVRNWRDAKRAAYLKGELQTVKDEAKFQIEALNKEMASLRSQRIEARSEEVDALRSQIDSLTLASARQSVKLPYYGSDLGFRIESAQFGSSRGEQLPALEKVRRLARERAKIPVSWQDLFGYDTHPNEEKFLTVTISITEREHGSHGIRLPSSLFMSTLEGFILTLREIQSADADKRFASLSPDGLSPLGDPEIGVRKARQGLELIHMLSDMLAVRTDTLTERATLIKLTHEAERIRALLLPSSGEAR